MTTHHKPTAPRGWRVLRKGEIIRKGDKVWTVGRWLNTLRDPGSVIGLLPYIRRKKASRNGKLPLAGRTRKIPTPSGVTKKGRKEKDRPVGWVNIYLRDTYVGACAHSLESEAERLGLDRVACIPLTDSMLKRWSTK